MEKTFARYHCLGGDGSERVFSQFYRFVSLCTITRNSVCKWFLLFCWVLVWFAKSSYGLLRSYPFQPYGISATAGDMSILFSGCLHLQSWCLLTFSNLGVRRTSVKFTGHRSSDDWWPLNIALWIRLLTLWPLLVGFGWVSDVIAIAYFFFDCYFFHYVLGFSFVPGCSYLQFADDDLDLGFVKHLLQDVPDDVSGNSVQSCSDPWYAYGLDVLDF